MTSTFQIRISLNAEILIKSVEKNRRRNVKAPANKGGGGSAASSCTCPGNTWRQCTRRSVHFPTGEGRTASAPDGGLHYRRDTCAALFRSEWSRFSILQQATITSTVRFLFKYSIISILLITRTFNFFGEFHSLGIGEWFPLFVDVANVQDLAHELDHRLWLIKGRGWDVDVEHHFPLGRTDRLMEAEPNLATAAEWMVISIGRWEEAPAHRSVRHRR